MGQRPVSYQLPHLQLVERQLEQVHPREFEPQKDALQEPGVLGVYRELAPVVLVVLPVRVSLVPGPSRRHRRHHRRRRRCPLSCGGPAQRRRRRRRS